MLIRVNQFNDVAATPLEEWMAYLMDEKIRPDTNAPGLEEACEKLKYCFMNAKEHNAYDTHLNAVMVQNDVLDAAKLEGKLESCAEGPCRR